MVQGNFTRANEVPDEVMAAYRTVARSEEGGVSKSDSITTISAALDWFAQFGAPFIDLDPSRIRAYADLCYQAHDENSSGCRSRVVIALATNGFFEDAQREFKLMLDDRLPFRSIESAELLARISGVELAPQERDRVVLISS
jgi:hypothetical protein